jgi:hypothetical protein
MTRERRLWIPTVALLGSLALHFAWLLTLRHWSVLPSVGLEFALPDQVEFGVAAANEIEPAAAPAATSSAPAASDRTRASTLGPSPAPKPASEPRRPAQPKPPQPAAAFAQAGAVAGFAPQGAQIALRLDLDRLRKNPLAEDTRTLLLALPDVEMLLDGSGIDPTRDLAQLFLASPDLRRSHVVMAGSYRGDETLPRAAVDSLAQHMGKTASWRTSRGIRVAPWYNTDDTARVLALIAPSQFAITREDDLPRVLSIARSLSKQSRIQPTGDGGLIHMREAELFAVAVENARAFVRGDRAQFAPTRFEISIRESGANHTEVQASAEYPDAAQAMSALVYWQRIRERYASHPLLALMGFASLLQNATLTTRDTTLEFHASVPLSQARLLLNFARDALGNPLRKPEPTRPAQTPEPSPP